MGVLKRDGFTARGYIAFSPWSDPSYAKSQLQINMGQSAIGLMDVINLGVLSNFSREGFYFDAYRDQRYHYEKQPQFMDEVASNVFPSVYAGISHQEKVKFDLLKGPQFLLPPHQTGNCNSALSIATHLEIDNQSNSSIGVLIRDTFTARGIHTFSPWNRSGYEKSLLQINLGYSALGLMDVINLGVLSNFSNGEFWFDHNRDQRYHMEKQPQFTDEVASIVFPSVNGPNSYPSKVIYDLLNSPTFTLPPHQITIFLLSLTYKS